MKQFSTSFILFIAFLFLSITANAQKVLWKKTDSTHTGSQGFFTGFDAENNVYTASGYFSASAAPIVFTKYDAAGNKQWDLPYFSSTQNIQLVAGMKTAPGGDSYAFGTGDGKSFLIKISPNGEVVWQVLSDLTGNAGIRLNSIILDDAGNIYVTGSNGAAMYTARYDSSANLIWSKSFSSTAPIAGESIDLDNDENVLVAGGGLVGDIIALKYSNDGNLIWSWSYGNSSFTNLSTFIPVVIKHDYSNYVYLIGLLQNSTNYSDTDFLFSIAPWGDFLWKENFYGENELADVTTDEFGNIYVLLNNSATSTIIKYNGSGLVSARLFLQDAAGGQAIHLYNIVSRGQHVYAGGNFGLSQFAVKTDLNLNMLWESSNGVNNSATTFMMTLDNANNVLLQGSAGLVIGSNGSADTTFAPLTTKIADSSGVVNGIAPVADLESIRFFPNPFSDQVNFDFNLANSSSVQFIIRNAEGKQVAALFDGFLSAGRHNFEWVPNHEPSGVYFYECRSGDFVKAGKISLIR